MRKSELLEKENWYGFGRWFFFTSVMLAGVTALTMCDAKGAEFDFTKQDCTIERVMTAYTWLALEDALEKELSDKVVETLMRELEVQKEFSNALCNFAKK